VHPRLWWQTGTIYQVYPRSFQDSNGDGIGDLAGVRSRLGHLKDLGVDAIWLSPIHPSPQADFGYDVSDYRAIDPQFGTMADFDALLAAVHAAGMKLLLDFVPNHTSDRHPWFVESRSSRANPKRSWYLWRDPAPDGGPPNRWQSVFGGSAWEKDEKTGQYYYHAFLKEQPDLDWRNPEVEAAMHDAVRFWLAKGLDGFRVDVIWHLIKDAAFRDNPPGEWTMQTGRPEVHETIARLRRVFDEYDARVMIGEIYQPPAVLATYYGTAAAPECHLPFNFGLIHPRLAWTAAGVRARIEAYEAALGPDQWPNWVLGNHDMPRVASRVGEAQARVAAMLLLTLRGTPTIYQGEEIGMKDVPIAPAEERDPRAKTQPGSGRDPVRTPMRWDSSPNAGFTTGTPWLPIGPELGRIDVETQSRDPGSMLSLYRRLLQLRRSEVDLLTAPLELLAPARDVLAFRRGRLVIALNFAGERRTLPGVSGRAVLSTERAREGRSIGGILDLDPGEGVVVHTG
jgi:alpha-glucosidase